MTVAPQMTRLDHFNIETAQPDATVVFYVEALGFEDLARLRPDVGRPGTWLGLNGHACIHVNFVDEPHDRATGPIDHVAFEGSGYLALRQRLDALDIAYDVIESPHLDLDQVYVRDPNGVLIEINIRGEGAGRAPAASDA